MQLFGLAMTVRSVTDLLLLAHRWVGLALAPLFLLVLLSGAVLAFKPIVEDFQTSTTVDPNTLMALLDPVSYCPLVHEVQTNSSLCRAITLMRSPFCRPRVTWTASSSPRLTRCNTV